MRCLGLVGLGCGQNATANETNTGALTSTTGTSSAVQPSATLPLDSADESASSHVSNSGATGSTTRNHTTSSGNSSADSSSVEPAATSQTSASIGTATAASSDVALDDSTTSVATGATESSESTTGATATEATSDASSPGDLLAPSEIVAELDGYLYRGECNGGSASFECPLSDCEGGVFERKNSITIGGESELIYDITLHVYGVVELRSDYHDGARRQGTKSNAQSDKYFFYTGGTYTRGSGYNVYGLRVEPAVDGVADAVEGGNNYFLNARDGSGEGHEVWELNYDATVLAAGGSTITFTAYDPNCLQIMNNRETARPSAGSGTNGAIVVDAVEDAVPPPSDFEQPLATAGRTGQWLYIDVVTVTAER